MVSKGVDSSELLNSKRVPSRVLNRVLNKLVNFSNHPDPELRMCDTYDWYAPRFQQHHRLSELQAWFSEAGFEAPRVLSPEKTGWFYRCVYGANLIIGSGVNVLGTRRED